MKSKLVFKAIPEWGWLGILITIILLLLNIFFIMLLFLTSYVFIIFFLPVVILDAVFFPLIKSMFRIAEFELHTDSVKVKNRILKWKDVKSISFQTGRLIYDRDYDKGFKLPALQKIYVLDKKGEEYSAVIGVDYFFKKKREDNNIKRLTKYLNGMNREELIADWAEKR